MLSGKKAFRKRQNPEPNSFQPRVNRFPIPEKKLVFFGKRRYIEGNRVACSVVERCSGNQPSESLAFTLL